MPSGLCEHPWDDVRLSDLLRSSPNQWQSLPVRLGEHWCWLLQEEERSSGSPLNTLRATGTSSKAGASDPAHAQNGLAELQTTDAMAAMVDVPVLVLLY